MIRLSDPSALTSAEIRAQLGAPLARAYRRLRLSREKVLDDRTPIEPSCEPPVHAAERNGDAATNPPSDKAHRREIG